jgi:hypothetical protein
MLASVHSRHAHDTGQLLWIERHNEKKKKKKLADQLHRTKRTKNKNFKSQQHAHLIQLASYI